jgi:hypothetical protein
LRPFGFNKNGSYGGGGDGAFSDRGDVYLYVAAVTQHHAGHNKIEPFGQIGFEAVNRIKIPFLEPGRPIRKATGTFKLRYSHFVQKIGAYIDCETEADVPDALQQVRELVLERMLPCLEKHSDPVQTLQAYLDHDERQVNSVHTSGAHDYSSALDGLILARLYGREHYESLKRRYQFFFDPLMPSIKEKALRLIAYLDDDPLPVLE